MRTELEIKVWKVQTGQSRIFKNWHEHAGVSQEDFIKALEWLDKDPMEVKFSWGTEKKYTRSVGCREDGTLVYGRQVYDRHDGRYLATYSVVDNCCIGFPNVCMSKSDRI